MPTAGELRLEQAHQRDLAMIGGGVTSAVANIALGADPAAISTWFFTAFDSIMARVSTGYAQSRRSGTEYMRAKATMAGADVDVRTGSLSLPQARTSLEVTGPVAFKRAVGAGMDDEEALISMATQMSGSAQRLAVGGDRDVLEQTIAHGKGVVGYRRVLGGPGCGFCAMLASRGAVYLSRESATTSRSGLRFHDHCVPAGTLVAGPPTEKAFRRWYEGELVVFRAGSNELSITPNHPVLTPRGWVPAGLLHEGDYVVEGSGFDWESADVPHEDDVPAPIEDVWRSLRVNGLVEVPVAAEDFHGDGLGTQGDVDVVAADGLLAFVRNGALCHEHAQQVGAWAGPGFVAGPLATFGDADLMFLGALAAADSLVGAGGQGPTFVGGHAAHPQFVGLAAIARLHAGLLDPAGDYPAGNAEALADAQNRLAQAVSVNGFRIGSHSDWRGPTEFRAGPDAAPKKGLTDGLAIQADSGRRLLETLAGRVQLRRMVDLRRIGSWSGHVYNLQTADGWYSANAIVVHNCRCHVEPMFTHEPDPPDVQRLKRQWQRVTAGKSNDAARVAWRDYWEQPTVDRSQLRLAAAKAGPPSPVPPPPTPAPGVVVRSGLDAKRTLTGLQEAWAAEAKRITGRTLDVEIPAGTSLQTAKEYAEGVLRGLERFPDATLRRIRFGSMPADQYAEAGARDITFNQRWANMTNRPATVAGMQADLAGWSQGRNGWGVRGGGTPTATAIHEFGHVIDIGNLGETIHSRALTLAQRRAALEGISMDDLVARDISVYAASDAHELIAEAFADVMLRGQAASPLAREIFDLLEAEYFKAGGRITPAFGTFPAKAAPKLAKMSVADLRALAAARGVTLPAKALKADIVRALEEAGPAVPRIVVEPGATRWLGKVDLTSMSAAEAERMGALVQAKSRREILDEIVQLRADGASNRALVNRIAGRSKLPNNFGVRPQVDDSFRDELLAAVDNGTIDDVVRRHLAALDVKAAPVATGREALRTAQIDLSGKRPAGVTAAEAKAVDLYANDAQRINALIREGRTASDTIRNLDRVIGRSTLTSDTELWRGLRSDSLFGDAARGDLAGFEWTDQAYLSTSANREWAARFAGSFDDPKPVILRVVAPQGTHGITVSDWGTFPLGPGGQAEVLLARGLRLRVVRDRGLITEPGIGVPVRALDVEVLPAVVEKPLAKRTVTELRALAKERNVTLPPKATKAQIVEALQAPPLTPAQIRAAEQKALRDAARERNRQIEQATGTARLLAEVDELLAKKASAATIRQRLDPALIRAEQVFAGADPAVREALAAALASGDMAKVRAAVTRLTTKAKLKVVGGKAGAKVKFDPATMESLGAEIADGAPVTVVTRGASVTLPDGTVVQVRKAQVMPVAKRTSTGRTRAGAGGVTASRAPLTSDEFDAALARAAAGDDALRASLVELRTAAERKAYTDYVSEFRFVNTALRENAGVIPAGRTFSVERRVAAGLDSAMERAGLAEDIFVHRVAGTREFEGGIPTVGAEWTDLGYTSTSTSRKFGGRGEVEMRILVPRGHRAVSAAELDVNEVLLNRSTRFRVVRVHLPDERGVWRLDVVVVG